jgi:hypothetical protein
MNSGYEIRLNNVKLMHETMTSMNHKDAYMAWIYEMTDEPQEDDFEWFAEDEERYIELYVYFMRTFKRYAKYGLFRPSESVRDFVLKLGIEIEILN